MRLVLAAALAVCCAAPALAAPRPLALAPADSDRDGVVSTEEAAARNSREVPKFKACNELRELREPSRIKRMKIITSAELCRDNATILRA